MSVANMSIVNLVTYFIRNAPSNATTNVDMITTHIAEQLVCIQTHTHTHQSKYE
jgi:hypothetical protein